MKHATLPSLLIILLGLATAPDLHAIQNCGNQNFKGTYGIFASGSIPAPIPGLSGPFARVGQVTADGQGNAVAQTTASYNGLISVEPFGGSYTVFPDCTIVLNSFIPFPGAPFPVPVDMFGALADNGRLVGNLIVFPPGITIQIEFRRQEKSLCSNQDLSKGFLVSMSGTIVSQPGVPAGAFARSGRVAFDGTSGFIANTQANYSGATGPEIFSGTYSVDSSCKLTMQYSFGGQAYTWTGALTDNSRGANLIVSSPAGAVVVGTLKQQ